MSKKNTAKLQQTADSCFQPRHTLIAQAVAGGRAIDRPTDKTRITQHFEMLGDGRLCQREHPDNIPGETLRVLPQEAHNLHPGRVAECLHHSREAFFVGAKLVGFCGLFCDHNRIFTIKVAGVKR